MKKVIKEKDPITGIEFTYIISEELSKLNGKIDAPQKLAKANETLRRTKDSLPFNIDKTKK
ncbi:MAG TPA: hypothetical protein VHD83_22555 [Puia sp.]|nr:hypothetical protein [Puia sp.]